MSADRELILASASRRRKELLQRIGLPFRAIPSRVQEILLETESHEDHVLRLCEEKAREIGGLHPDHWIIGADTIVLVDGTVLGKPRNRNEARWMLDKLQGKTHEVFTGICLLQLNQEKIVKEAVRTAVHMKALSEEEISWYLHTAEPFDKAGGYAIQGFGSVLIRGIEGSYTNVVGLPLTELIQMLRESGAWNLFART